MIDPNDPININGRWWLYDAKSRTHKPADGKPEPRPNRRDDPGQAANVELPTRSEPMAAGKGAAFDSPVDITVVSYRSRLCDADGISAKAAIDGLVMCGILADDTTKEIREVRYRQVKVKNANEEKTELIIERILN
jgi:hypothetical protein